jgi:hypothetical protein
MSKAELKPATQAALKKAGISHTQLGAAVGRDRFYVWRALSERLPPEKAGEMVRVLGEMAGLSTAERQEVFKELVNWPGEKDKSFTRRISSEDPMAELREATAERYGDEYGPSYDHLDKDF